MATQTYLVALGGNVFGSWGTPERLLQTRVIPAKAGTPGDWSALLPPGVPAFAGMTRGLEVPAFAGMTIIAMSPIHRSAPLGPGTRRYANAVAVVESALMPRAFLAHLKAVERAHGRRGGRRWGNRSLDLDVIGWSGGRWATRALTVPHPAFRHRSFVLVPLAQVAPRWRDPVTGLTPLHLLARLPR